MEIKFLKAGSGDCILIQNEGKNVLIDGGNDSVFLIDEYYKITSRKEKIDLLIITHHDDDHINGILKLFEHLENKNETPEIETIIFNSPKKINSFLKEEEEVTTNLLSYKQAYELENVLFKNRDIQWITSMEKDINELFNEKFGEMKLEIFSPNEDILNSYASNNGAYLNSDHRCDWNTPMKELEQYIDDKSQDSSLSNKTSIVVYATFKEKKILLPADVTPGRFNEIIDKIRGSKEKADLDLIKLPHHGSYRSLNSKVLQKINCKNYVISTNSLKHYLPNKRAIIKIVQNLTSSETLNFLFNYEESIHKLRITDKEISEYKIKLKPNTDNWGYGINF